MREQIYCLETLLIFLSAGIYNVIHIQNENSTQILVSYHILLSLFLTRFRFAFWNVSKDMLIIVLSFVFLVFEYDVAFFNVYMIVLCILVSRCQLR